MYTPTEFKKSNSSELFGFIEKYNFATLVTQHQGRPLATHIPLILDKTRGSSGALIGHMARANSQWKDFLSAQNILCIFSGPHAYVSPSWYVEERNVPTWNYAAVHVYGQAKIIDDLAGLDKILHATVSLQERDFAKPWKFEMPDDYKTSLMKAIVGFEIKINEIQGKFKLSQNRSDQDFEGAVRGLKRQGGDNNQALVTLMNQEHKKP